MRAEDTFPFWKTCSLGVRHLRKENCLSSQLPRDMWSEEFLCSETKRNCEGPDQKEESCVSLEPRAALCWLRFSIIQGKVNREGIRSAGHLTRKASGLGGRECWRGRQEGGEVTASGRWMAAAVHTAPARPLWSFPGRAPEDSASLQYLFSLFL